MAARATSQLRRLFIEVRLANIRLRMQGMQHRFERKQRFDEEPVAACPVCAGKSRRVIHSVPIVFKGSGFYCTDHSRGSSGNGRKKDSDLESTTATTSKSDTDTTSAPKAEKKAESTADA